MSAGAVAVWLAVVAPTTEGGDAVAPATGEGSPAAEAVTLAWDAPPACPDEAVVRRGLAAYLGAGPTAEAGAAVTARAQVRQTEAGFELSLRTETSSGVTTREASAEDCMVLVDATALIVAIAVDPSTVVGRATVPPNPVAPPEPETAEPADEEPEAPPVEVEPPPDEDAPPLRIVPVADAEPSSPPRLRFGMQAAGGVSLGALPKLSGGVRLSGALLGSSWRAELRGDAWLPRTTVVEEGVGARISLWAVGARGCYAPEILRRTFEFPLCGGVEAGAMRGDPVGDRVVSPETSRRAWLAADASVGISWVPWRYLALMARAELTVPILRTGFRVGELEVHRAEAVGGRALLGLEVRFP